MPREYSTDGRWYVMYARDKWTPVSEYIGRIQLGLGQFHVKHPKLEFVTLEYIEQEAERRQARRVSRRTSPNRERTRTSPPSYPA